MNIKLALFYGFRNLLGKSSRGNKSRHPMVLPIISIALSIIPVIVILEVSSGMIEGITARFLEFESGHLSMVVSDEAAVAAIEERLPEILAAPGVTNAAITRRGGGLFFFKNQRYFVSLRAVGADFYKHDPGFQKYAQVEAGFFDLSEKGSIIIGKALADEFGIAVGDSVLIFTHQTILRGGKLTKQARPTRFTVRGIYSIGYQELDKLTVFIPAADGERILAAGNLETRLVIKVQDPFDRIEAQAAVLEKVIDPDFRMFFRLETWPELNSNYYSAYEGNKMLLVLIMLLIVLVAAFNISSSMIMLVLDRIQEIGILKSIGASPGTITLSFICGGFLAGLVATLLGVGAGLAIAVNINEIFVFLDRVLTTISQFFVTIAGPFFPNLNADEVKILNPEFYIETIPIRINPWEIVFVSLLAVILAVFFSFYPARMAGKVRPLEVIRKY